MEAYRTNLFYINYIFLNCDGLWPPSKDTPFRYRIYKICQSAVLLYMFVFGTYCLIRGIFESTSDFTTLTEVMNVSASVFLCQGKIIFWFKYGERLKNVMNILENNEFHYDKIDDFDPVTIIKNVKRTGTKYCLILFVFAELTIAFGYVPACALSFWYYVNGRPISDVSNFKTLPNHIHIPFEHDTAITYLLACLLHYLLLHLMIVSCVGIDGLFMNLVNLVGEQMIILQGAFRSLRKRCVKKIIGPALTTDNLYNSDELEEMMMFEMKKCIRHLQLLLSSCDQIEEIFKFVTLCQALTSLYVLCSSLLLVSTTPILTKQFGQNLFYWLGIATQLGLYCWPGNELTLKVEQVSAGLWESDWLQTRQPFKRCMLITMMRLQKPLYLTAGKFVPLALGTEISVFKGSYSYFTVLSNMSNK